MLPNFAEITIFPPVFADIFQPENNPEMPVFITSVN